MTDLVELTADLAGVVQAVSAGRVVHAIKVTAVPVDFEPMRQLGAFLSVDTTLLQLSFYDCRVSAEALDTIVNALLSNPKTSLKSLNLGKCGLNDQAAPILARLFQYNTSLVEMNLVENSFSQVGLDQMAQALDKYNFYIQEIYSHRIGDTSNITWSIFQPVSRNKLNNKLKHEFADKLDNSKLCRWGRAKLMVIGQGGAGKTSTVRCLLGQEFVAQHDSTIGASLNKTDTKNWQQKDTNESDFNEAAARAIKEQVEAFDAAQAKERKAREKRGRWRTRVSRKEDKVAVEEPKKRSTRLGNMLGLSKKEKPGARAKPGGGRSGGAQNRPGQRHRVVAEQEEEVYEVDREPQRAAVFKPLQNEALLKEVDVARRFRRKLLMRAMEDAEDEDDETKLTFTIWDYGGQSVFYTLHHLFLTKYGVYIIVFDLSTFLEGRDLSVPVDFLKFWIQSVMLHAPNAPCIIVGTHLDEVVQVHNSKDALTSFLDGIGDILEEDVGVLRHARLMKPNGKVFLPLNNRTGENIESLRDLIDESARDEFYVNQKIPLRWILTLDLLVNEEEAVVEGGKGWVSLAEVEGVGRKFGLSNAEVSEMLKLFHQLGVLIYLSATEALRSIVVINPQWLIDKLGKVIRDDMHGLPEEIEDNVQAAEEWKRLRTTGAASRDLFDDVWSDKKLPVNVATRTPEELIRFNSRQTEFLLDLMKHTMLLSDWYWTNDTVRGERLYLIPSIIRTTKEDVENLNAVLRTWPKTCQSLYLDFSDFFLPTGVFQRLVCLFVSIIANQIKDAPEPILGENFALLSFNGSAGKKFNTQLYLTQMEQDRIMMTVKDQSQSKDMLNMVQVLVRKLRSEVMGSRLKIKMLLTLHQSVGVPPEDGEMTEAKTEVGENDLEGELTPVPIGPYANKSKFVEKEYFQAKEDTAFGTWFQQTREAQPPSFVNIDNFFT